MGNILYKEYTNWHCTETVQAIYMVYTVKQGEGDKLPHNKSQRVYSKVILALGLSGLLYTALWSSF